MNKYTLRALLLIFLLNPIYKTFAHHPDNSLLYLKVYENTNIEGDFHINVNELNDVLGLHLSKRTSIEEVTPYLSKIKKYLLENTSFSSLGKTYKIVFTDKIRILYVGYGDFVLVNFYLENTSETPDKLEVTYKVFIEEEPKHMNLLGMEYNWKAGLFNNESIIALDFSNNNWTKTLDLTKGSIWTGFKAMIKQGIWHIWIGLDHILFIIALILPAVVRRQKFKDNSFRLLNWKPVDKFKPAFIYILKIITFFTIAHTITLSLASLQIIVLPSQLVESIIALSIGLAAYHNIKPIFKGKDWIIAFVFGLFHGFGFASVLGDLGFNGEHLTLSLLGFNVGVELGQVAIIAGIFPVLYFIRKYNFYPKFLVYTSVLLIIISIYWLIERAFGINLMLDDYLKMYAYETAKWLGLK